MLIETQRFELREGVTESEFLAADRQAQAFAHLQPGIVRRTTARGGDGRWLVITLWGSAEYADAAGRAGEADAAAQAFAACLDPTSESLERYETLD